MDSETRVKNICPECEQGKCSNCTDELLTDNDDWVYCECRHGKKMNA